MKVLCKDCYFVPIRSQTFPPQVILVSDWLISKKSSRKPLSQTDRKLIQYSQRHSVIIHCDRRITLLSDTDISFGQFNLFTYFHIPFV